MGDVGPRLDASDRWLEVGIIVKPHGVRGAFKIRLHDPHSSIIENCDASHFRIVIDQSNFLDGLRLNHLKGSDEVIVSCDRISTMDVAQGLRGKKLFVEKNAIAIEADEYLVADLIGSKVIEGTRCFGVVKDVFSSGASDILVVSHEDGERFIPLVDQWVKHVDTKEKTIELIDGDVWEAQ